jgi:predicted DNA-binding protein with PD1-like motif
MDGPQADHAMSGGVGPRRSGGNFAVLRLMPGEDLLAGLDRAIGASGARAGAVGACVGSLTRAVLRLAGRDAGTLVEGPLEIVALSGTLEPGGRHLHAAVADADGRVTGGHVLPGCTVRTTAEIVLLTLDDLTFGRAPCPVSGYRELTIG